ncbi:hypothetical protein BI330_16835 [Mycobacterium sp. CBMA 623]|nr:hypothetical protein [Mycobacteroides sp. CBMA 326]
MAAVVLVALAAGCGTDEPAQVTKTPQGVEAKTFVFQTQTSIGVARGGAIAAELHGGAAEIGDPIRLTTNHRYAYWLGDSGVSVVDTRNLERRVIPCNGPCLGFPSPVMPIGDSLVGGFDAGEDDHQESERDTTSAFVRALDLSAIDPQIKTIGSMPLLSPHPAQHNVAPYTFYLDAANGIYAFLDAVNYRPSRPWELAQTLWFSRLDGSILKLGNYAFGSRNDVWGAMSPDGASFVMGGEDPSDSKTGAHCGHREVDMIDTATGARTAISPADPAASKDVEYRVSRAWWGTDGTLYANYQQANCSEKSSAGAPPSVWAYRAGRWSRVETQGPAIFALELGNGARAVVVPKAAIPDGQAAWVDMTKGTLYYLNGQGQRTWIADDVVGLADLPER